MSKEATIPAGTGSAPDSAEDSKSGGLTGWQRFTFGTVRGFLRLHTAVWGLRGMYLSCQFFGACEYLINYKRRKKVRQMLKKVFGRELVGDERRRVIREHFMRQRCDKTFYLVFDYLSTEQVKANFTMLNPHLMDDGLARGKGVYVMLCHHGAHHVIGMIMSSLGYRVGGVRDPQEGAIRKFVQELWERRHPDLPRTKVLYSGDFARPIFRLLQENYAMGSALDVTRLRDERLKTAPVDIFGEERQFLTGPLEIALRCQSVVLQGFIVSEDDFRYRLELHGPMTDPDADGHDPQLLADVLQRYADNIAEYARKYPDHITRV